MARRGFDLSVITSGEEGAWIQAKDGDCFYQAAFPVKGIVDTTGCGDIYHGAFLHALCSGLSLPKAAQIAGAAAAIKAGELGGRGVVPCWAEINAFLMEHGDCDG